VALITQYSSFPRAVRRSASEHNNVTIKPTDTYTQRTTTDSCDNS